MPVVELVVGQNAYCSIEEADAYIATRLHADDWPESDDSSPDEDITKSKALMWASRILNKSYEWASDDHELPTEAEIPQEIKDATAELALYLIRGDRTADKSSLSALTAGPVSLTFAEPQQDQTIPDSVQMLIGDEIGELIERGRGSITFGRVVRA